jgi:hypothetical protein
MSYNGTVKNGVVVLPPQAKLPEGSKVQVTLLETSRSEGDAGQWLLQFAGTVKGLPRDFARNHDHYIHGTAKR